MPNITESVDPSDSRLKRILIDGRIASFKDVLQLLQKQDAQINSMSREALMALNEKIEELEKENKRLLKIVQSKY